MPLIVKWPGVTKPGSRATQMVQNLDYAETFLEMAGAEVPQNMQGMSLVPILKNGSAENWRKSIYYHYYEFPSVHMVPRHYGIRTERYKLMHFYQFGNEWEMYDLKEDPDELANIYGKAGKESLQTDLKKQLVAIRKRYDDNSNVAEKPEAWKKQMRP